MRRNRGRRVEKINRGYGDKKRTVHVPRENEGVEKVVEKRVERGYRKGYKKRSKSQGRSRSEEGGRTVERGYTQVGTAVIQERKGRSRPSRPRRVTSIERWGRQGKNGTYRRETTEGRKTREEARQKELGGRRRRWVR